MSVDGKKARPYCTLVAAQAGRLDLHPSIRSAALVPNVGFPLFEIADWAFFGRLVFGICNLLETDTRQTLCSCVAADTQTFKLSPHCCHRSRRITSWTAAEITTSAPDILVLSCLGQIHRLFCSFSPILIVSVCRPHAKELGAISHSLAAGLVKRQTKHRKGRDKLCQRNTSN